MKYSKATYVEVSRKALHTKNWGLGIEIQIWKLSPTDEWGGAHLGVNSVEKGKRVEPHIWEVRGQTKKESRMAAREENGESTMSGKKRSYDVTSEKKHPTSKGNCKFLWRVQFLLGINLKVVGCLSSQTHHVYTGRNFCKDPPSTNSTSFSSFWSWQHLSIMVSAALLRGNGATDRKKKRKKTNR